MLPIILLLLFSSAGAIIKQEQRVDPRSGEYTLVQEETSDRCYQYTWVGIQGRDQVGGVNGSGTFPSCETLEESFPTLYGRMIPCYEPTVYTYNNEYGTNRPNLSAIVEACNNQGCDPYCSRSGDSCVKYTVINNDDERSVEWESSFCGQVTTQWNGEVVSSGNCYTERDVMGSQDHQVCFCDDSELCNGGEVVGGLVATLLLPLLVARLL